MKKVTVIIPTHNRAGSILTTIESVLRQTRAADEILVVDDGSTDDTAKVLMHLKAPVRFVQQPNAGASAARNTGLRLAQGELVAFLDAEDWWAPQKLERQTDFMARSGCLVSFTGHQVSDGDKLLDEQTIRSHYPDMVAPDIGAREEALISDPLQFITGFPNHPLLPTLVADKQVIEKAGFFDETLYAGGDTRFIYNLALRAAVGYLNAPLATVIRSPATPGISGKAPPEVVARRYQCRMRVHMEVYWRLVETRRPELRIIRARIGYLISRQAELACALGYKPLARSLARDGLLFARDRKTVLRCLGALVWPRRVGAHCRTKFPGYGWGEGKGPKKLDLTKL